MEEKESQRCDQNNHPNSIEYILKGIISDTQERYIRFYGLFRVAKMIAEQCVSIEQRQQQAWMELKLKLERPLKQLETRLDATIMERLIDERSPVVQAYTVQMIQETLAIRLANSGMVVSYKACEEAKL